MDLSFAKGLDAERRAHASRGAVARGELIAGFSHALDLAAGRTAGHAVGVCWIGGHIGRQIGLDKPALRDLHHVLLLKDLGASSSAPAVAASYRMDDRAFGRGQGPIAGGAGANLRFLWDNVARTAPLRRRLPALWHVVRNCGAIAHDAIEMRSSRGAEIARRLRFPDDVAGGIRAIDEHWDGGGLPGRLRRDAIPLFARIALIAQVAEIFHAAAGPRGALAEVVRQSGRRFDPGLVAAFRKVARRAAFWRALASPALERRVLLLEPAALAVPVDDAYLDEIVAAFGEVADAKGRHMAGHSTRVAALALAVADRMGFDPDRRRWLRHAALLHDIGSLGVSSAILDKPGPLTEAEWFEMRGHAVHTQTILGRIPALADMAPIAAAHHERLDGTGYPLKLGGVTIGMATRIITVADMFAALTADRPHRPAMTVPRALAIIEAQAGTAIDPRCLAALTDVCAPTIAGAL